MKPKTTAPIDTDDDLHLLCRSCGRLLEQAEAYIGYCFKCDDIRQDLMNNGNDF